jgi:hypothetical protein
MQECVSRKFLLCSFGGVANLSWAVLRLIIEENPVGRYGGVAACLNEQYFGHSIENMSFGDYHDIYSMYS